MPVISGFSMKMLWFTHIAVSFVFQKCLTYYISQPSIFNTVFIGRQHSRRFKSIFLNKTRRGRRFAVKWVLIISLDIKGPVGECSLFLSLIPSVTHTPSNTLHHASVFAQRWSWTAAVWKCPFIIEQLIVLHLHRWLIRLCFVSRLKIIINTDIKD